MRMVHGVRIALCLVALLAVQANLASALTINLRSGNVPPTALDPLNTYLVEPSGGCGVGFPAVFSAADFSAAAGGPNAFSVNPISVWLPTLPCDPAAYWISTTPNLPSRSALYAQPFQVKLSTPVCCIHQAILTFCWSSDDAIGDQPGFGPVINPSGVYLNGVALPISGAGYATAQFSGPVDVTSILTCGPNTLYVYNRDLGCAVAGVMYHCTIDVTECFSGTKGTTWGSIRKLYR